MDRIMEDVEARQEILKAAMNHVAFDGWAEATFYAALSDSGVPEALGLALFPRKGLDLALAYHHQGDGEMVAQLAKTDLGAMRFRDRIAYAVMLRLSLADREAVRRGTALMALPHLAAEGSRAIWSTADAIWTALGDSSKDVNWYSKRMTLSAVYAATVLYWLGDDSPDSKATRDFLDRRIDGVMQIEKLKANPLAKALSAGPLKVLSGLKAPQDNSGLPGRRPSPKI